MKTMDDVKKIISRQMVNLHRLYGVKQLEIFGSYARGEQREDSDIDVLVEFDQPVSLLEVTGLEQYLSEKLEIRVDVVLKRSVRPELRDIILDEAVSV